MGKIKQTYRLFPTGAAVAILPVFPRLGYTNPQKEDRLNSRGSFTFRTRISERGARLQRSHGAKDLCGRQRGRCCRITRHREISLAAQVVGFLQFVLLRVTPGAPRLLSIAPAAFHGSDGVHSTRDQGVWTMFAVRRLLAVGTVLMLVGLLASTHLWGRTERRRQIAAQQHRPEAADQPAHRSACRRGDVAVAIHRSARSFFIIGRSRGKLCWLCK